MFSKSARLYDAIYLNMGKDYAAEAIKVHGVIQQHKQTSGNLLLDVACGTGLHCCRSRNNVFFWTCAGGFPPESKPEPLPSLLKWW